MSDSPHAASGRVQGEFKRRRSIVFTLLAVLVLVGILPLWVAFKAIRIAEDELKLSYQESQMHVVRSLQNEIDSTIADLQMQLARLKRTLEGMLSRKAEVDRDLLERVMDELVDEDVPYLRYSHFQGSSIQKVEAGRASSGAEPYFQSALGQAALIATSPEASRNQITPSDPILLGEEQKPILTLTAPVVAGGKFRGVVSALVDLERVWAQAVEHLPTSYFYFAIDRTGRVVASTLPRNYPVGSTQAESAMVRRALRDRIQKREALYFSWEENGRRIDLSGAYALTDLGWGVCTQADMDDVLSNTQKMRQKVRLWVVVTLGLTALCASVFARTLSQPAMRLADAARAFARGEFSTRVEVRSSNEIGELAFTFNRMAEEIEDRIVQLRQSAEENRELFLGTIRALAQAIDAKDPYTRGHSVRVNKYSVILARQIGLSEKEVQAIHVASLMHDVGKIGIHDAILQKPGKLDAGEFEVMKTHTVLGANIMSPIKRMRPMIAGLRSHHERWSGGGYPDGLAGEQIPLMARIIAVADAFDAMTTHRPYQRAMTFAQALQRLNDLKTAAFDERVVEAFNRAYLQGAIRPEQLDGDAAVEIEEPAAASA